MLGNFFRYNGEAEDLACNPSGGPFKQWFTGVALAGAPIIYGIFSIHRGQIHNFIIPRLADDFKGDEAFWLALMHIAIGAFIHFHYFWGLSDRLERFSGAGKTVALLTFLGSLFWFGYVTMFG